MNTPSLWDFSEFFVATFRDLVPWQKSKTECFAKIVNASNFEVIHYNKPVFFL